MKSTFSAFTLKALRGCWAWVLGRCAGPVALGAGTRARHDAPVVGERTLSSGRVFREGKTPSEPMLCHISFQAAKEGADGAMGLQPCAC